MKTATEVGNLEKLILQLKAMHSEVGQLAKKSPNDGLNLFKLKLVNKVLSDGNSILTGHYAPFADFHAFSDGDLPTNSDVTLVLAQYIEQAERFRSNNVTYHEHKWVYLLDGKPSNYAARASTKVGGDGK